MRCLVGLACIVVVATTCVAEEGTTRGTQDLQSETTYHAYWLVEVEPAPSEYQYLLVTLGPLEDLTRMDEAATHPLDAEAMTFRTYGRDSLWRDPFHPVSVRRVDGSSKAVTVEGIGYRFETCSITDLISLLERPLGTIPISRRMHPLTGMEQTAKAFRLLLLEQLEGQGPTTDPSVPR